MLVKFLSAPTCPGVLDLTSQQFFQMTFTKSSKSPKITDNTVGDHQASAFRPLFSF